MDNFCHFCGNKGKENGCPKCGKRPAGFSMGKLEIDLPAVVIPIGYQGKMWQKPQPDGNFGHADFDGKLDVILKEFQKGNIPKFSTFISTPAKGGKHSFVYSCMQAALLSGFTVAPFFNTSDWRRLYRVSQTNPLYKLYGEYLWDKLVRLDVVFMFVDHSDDRYDTIPLLKDILDVRAGFNLPTFIISDFELTTLVPGWNKDTYKMIHNPAEDRDFLRYPVILNRAV